MKVDILSRSLCLSLLVFFFPLSRVCVCVCVGLLGWMEMDCLGERDRGEE